MSQYRSQRFRVERVPSGISYPAKRIYTPKAKKSTLALPKNITFDENEDSLGLPEAQANAASSFMSSTPTWRSEHASPSPLPSNQLQPPSPPAMLYLPVLRVDVKVSVDGTVAHTTLVQHFHNDFDNPIPKASYTFPLYDGAVVTSFRYKAQDKELVGQVKPKEQARQEFERARETKKAAALLEEHTPEIFETVVGNIPANTTVEVHIMYVGELRAHVLQQHDMPNKLDVVIPVSIAPRYGSPSRGDMTSTVPQGGGLNIRIEVNDNGTIQNLTSPTHGDAVSVKKVEPESITVASFALLAEEATVTQQVATYSSPLMTMNGDFVLTIEANPQYLLRSRAVLSGPNENGHAALMVNIKPRDIFEYDFRPENFAGEIIFLLDRSGSMGYGGGLDSLETVTKIGTLRPAMNLALASLPEHCVFNIASFGTDCEFLWQESQQHSKENISYARRYVYKDVRANMGSTEMLFALQEVVKSRLEDRPSTQIIIVTDGELEDDGITSFVFKTHQAHQDRIRFFALGIGEEVSHRLIEDIGEFGGGYGEVINIKKKPQWEGHLMRMLRLGLAPSRWIYDISFGSGFERRSLREYRLGQNPKDKETVSYIQAPYPTPAFHPFSYRSLFFLFQVGLTKKLPPTKIMLKPRNTGSKAGAQHTLQVEPTWTDRSTIHHLAVKAALIDLEAEASRENTLVAQSDIGRQNAELLGKMYSIASKWTGFVAVDQKTESSAIVDIYKADLIDVDLDDLEASIEADEASGDSSSDDHVPGAFRPIVPAPTISKNIFDQVSVSQDVEPQCLRPPRPGHHPLRPGPQQIPVRMPEPKSELPQTNPTPPPPSPPPPPVLQKPAPKPEPKPEMRHELPPSRPPPPPPVQKPQPNPALPYGVFFPPPPPPAAVQKPKPPVSAQDQINLEEHGLSEPGPSSQNTAPPNHPASQAPRYMHPGGVFDCSSGSSSFGDDSDEMDDQEFDNVFESRRDVTDNSVSWTEAMNAQSQNNLNLFELPESPRERLHSHFCSGIVSALKQAMQQCSATKELSNHHQALVIDTLMMMQYFKVHFARKRDLWDMMVGKAEIALLRILQFSLEDDDALEPFDMILECSTAHAHFLPGEKLPDDGRPGPFPPSTAMKSCLACATAPDTDVSAHKGSHPEGPMALDCPFQNCEEIETEWNDWDKLWEHQVMSGHVVCRKREWFGNLDDEFSE